MKTPTRNHVTFFTRTLHTVAFGKNVHLDQSLREVERKRHVLEQQSCMLRSSMHCKRASELMVIPSIDQNWRHESPTDTTDPNASTDRPTERHPLHHIIPSSRSLRGILGVQGPSERRECGNRPTHNRIVRVLPSVGDRVSVPSHASLARAVQPFVVDEFSSALSVPVLYVYGTHLGGGRV